MSVPDAAESPAWSRRPEIAERAATTVAVLAGVVEAVQLATTGWPLGGYAGLAVSAAGLVTCRRLPLLAVVLVSAAPVLAALLGWDPIALWNIAVFAVLSLVIRGSSPVLAGVVAGVANFAAVIIFNPSESELPVASVAGVAAVAAAAIGSAIRSSRRYWEQLRLRAEEAIHTREAEAERRVTEERLRIARDLHDVVGHEIAVVSMHLGVAEVALPETAADAQAALTAARSGVQAVLRETQQILRVLRVTGDEADLGPTPDYSAVGSLIDSFTALGMEIDATVPSLASPLDPAVGSAAYRVIQEALTNAHRHGTGSVRLRVEQDAEMLTIEVVNPVKRRTAGSGADERRGYGLVGMRERVLSTGGRVSVETSDDLFRVVAVLDGRGSGS